MNGTKLQNEIKMTLRLTKLQLTNLYGMNVIRYTKDKKAKRNALFLALAYGILLVMAGVLLGGLAAGYLSFGLADALPALFVFMSSLLILMLTMFRAGSIVFQKNFYEMLCALPVSQNAIVISRFLRLYVENLILSLVIMGSGLAVYGWQIRPHAAVYLMWAVTALVLPIIPIVLAVLLGTVIAAVSSRMKHKSIITSVLMIGLVVSYMFAVSKFAKMDERLIFGMLLNISRTVMNIVHSIYPPAVWFGKAILQADLLQFLTGTAVSIMILAAAVLMISWRYHWICSGLFGTSAKHEYQITKMTRHSVLKSLYKREMKRYFASSVYVMNTIIGPIMAVVLSVAVFMADWDMIEMMTGIMIGAVDIHSGIPFLIAGIFCMMPTTASAISMEGKEWWIIKSLPVKTKDVINSKLLLNLSLDLPFYLVSEILLIAAIKPNGLYLLWMILIPMILILFGCVMGLTVNLRLPVFDWENEAYVVKQSASAFLGGICSFLLILICAIPGVLLKGMYQNLWNIVVCVGFAGVTWCLYRRICKVKLEKL